MNLLGLDLSWIIGGAVGLLALLAGFFKVKSDAKKEGVQQERTRQVEQTAKAQETFVDNTTKARQSDTPALDKGLARWSRNR